MDIALNEVTEQASHHIKMALVLFEERGSELADRRNLKPPNSFSLSSEARLIAWGVGLGGHTHLFTQF